MPTPPSQAPTIARTTYVFDPETGLTTTPTQTTMQTANLPTSTPAIGPTSVLRVLGFDAAQFSLAAAGSTTVTFYNLPLRDNTVNPLSSATSSQKPLSIEPKDVLMMQVGLQGVSSAVAVVASAIAIDRSNVRVPGPFLGSGVFLTFQAKVTAAAACSGFVTALLLLSVG